MLFYILGFYVHRGDVMKRLLVTGATGQIGTELVPKLRQLYGVNNVIACGLSHKPAGLLADGPFEMLDVRDKKAIEALVDKYQIDSIFHLAAILSALGEQKPQLAFEVNLLGTYNILEIGRDHKLERLIIPSSMAAFGPDTPKENTPNDTIQRPTSMYGVTKVAGEQLGNYYFAKFGVDVRGVRFPGILSAEVEPTAGTTDYSTAVFYSGIRTGAYECFLRADTKLPMMYMPDAIKALIDLANAPLSKLKHHADYNVAAMSFTPAELFVEIQKYIPNLKITYKPDYHQPIADSWPRSLDDSCARAEWGWKPDYDLHTMVKDLYEKLYPKLTGKPVQNPLRTPSASKKPAKK